MPPGVHAVAHNCFGQAQGAHPWRGATCCAAVRQQLGGHRCFRGPSCHQQLPSVGSTYGRCGSLRIETLPRLANTVMAGGSFAPLSMELESYVHLRWTTMQFLCTLADTAASSVTAGSDVTTSFFLTAQRSIDQRGRGSVSGSAACVRLRWRYGRTSRCHSALSRPGGVLYTPKFLVDVGLAVLFAFMARKSLLGIYMSADLPTLSPNVLLVATCHASTYDCNIINILLVLTITVSILSIHEYYMYVHDNKRNVASISSSNVIVYIPYFQHAHVTVCWAALWPVSLHGRFHCIQLTRSSTGCVAYISDVPNPCAASSWAMRKNTLQQEHDACCNLSLTVR
jgi:hypothetical protein